MVQKLANTPIIVNGCDNNSGKKAYIKPSMEVYPLCDEILGPDATVSGKLTGPEYGGDLYEQD